MSRAGALEGVKGALERLLLHGGPAALSRRFRAGRCLVLAYHNVVPIGESAAGERSLHLPQRRFGEQLDTLLEQGAEVVSLEALISTRHAKAPRVSITFDDGYRGALTAGWEELAKRGLPATVFVVPGLLGGQSFWWDVLADRSSGDVLPEVRTAALDEMGGRTSDVLAWARGEGVRLSRMPEHARTTTEEELARAANEGFAVGSHTWSHPNLVHSVSEEARQELERPIAWLTERVKAFVPWLSYPYGLFSDRVVAAARTAGYRGALRIDGGWVPREPLDLHPYHLPRLNVPAGLSLRGFALRTSGLLCG